MVDFFTALFLFDYTIGYKQDHVLNHIGQIHTHDRDWNYKYVHTMHCTVYVELFYDSRLKIPSILKVIILIKEVKYLYYFHYANQFNANMFKCV